MKKEILLDEAAQNLFEALGGIDRSDRTGDVDRGQGGLASTLVEEETPMDERRLLLIEFVFRLAGYFKGLRLSGASGENAAEMQGLFPYLEKLVQMPDRQDPASLPGDACRF